MRRPFGIDKLGRQKTRRQRLLGASFSASFSVLVALVSSIGMVDVMNGPERLALIVAIGDYPDPEFYGYSKINGDNDIPLVTEALRSQGFTPEYIRTLVNEEATRQGILQAFQSHLIEAAQPGDIVAFHFSGHGHQITDDNGDELDGYDEVLVPYGAPALSFEGYKGEKHVRDDELNNLVTELRAKVGPTGNVFVSIDACFSGSATRAAHELPVRGVHQPLGEPSTARGNESGIVERGAATRGSVKETDLAPFVVISATSHDELDHEVVGPEGKPVGPLSLVLNRTMPRLRRGMSYGAFFEMVRSAMAAEVQLQTPQIEGNVEQEVFGGNAVDSHRYVRVREVVGDSVAIIEGGTLYGIRPGAGIRFYALDSAPEDDPVGRGVVVASDATSARVQLANPSSSRAVSSSRALATEVNYGDLVVRVVVENIPEPHAGTLRQGLSDARNLTVVRDAPDLVFALDSSNRLLVRTAAENVVIAGPFDISHATEIEKAVEHAGTFARSRFLRQLELHDPAIDVRFDIVPATHDANCSAPSDTTSFGAERTASGWLFHEDDGYLLRLRNRGRQGAFVAVISLPSDGQIDQLFPYEEYGVSDNYLEPGATHFVDLCYWAAPPFGDEVLKLFATQERVNFRPILASRGATRGEQEFNYFEWLVASTYTGTRSRVGRRATDSGTTHALTIRVIP